jgi:hypothetical protein
MFKQLEIMEKNMASNWRMPIESISEEAWKWFWMVETKNSPLFQKFGVNKEYKIEFEGISHL